jgi:CheY-like chemotaxis protein
MDGFQVLEAMRQRPEWQDVPVVVVTAKDLTPGELAWLRSKTEKVFHKGAYGRAELVALVEGAIVRHGQAASAT